MDKNLRSDISLLDAADTARKEASGVKTEYVEGTPFAIRGLKEEWYVMWGKFPISPKMRTFEAAIDLIQTRDYTILHNMASIIAHSVYNEGLANLVANVEEVINQKAKNNE